jgi:hypothetical protein
VDSDYAGLRIERPGVQNPDALRAPCARVPSSAACQSGRHGGPSSSARGFMAVRVCRVISPCASCPPSHFRAANIPPIVRVPGHGIGHS